MPTTNPDLTPAGNAIYAIKARDVVIFSPHPRSKKTTFETVRLMREAVLHLAVSDPHVRPLINPRQSSPIAYLGSPLNQPATQGWSSDLAAPGAPAPEALLTGPQGPFHLTQLFGRDFVCLVFSEGPLPQAVRSLVDHGVAVLDIEPAADPHGQAWGRYGLAAPGQKALVLVRPDGYVMGRWHGLDPAPVIAALQHKELTQ